MTRRETPESAAPGGPRFRSVLFICAANTARSVMAEHMLKRELHRRGIESDVRVASAGIAPYARDSALISLDTRMVLREVGIHLDEDSTSTDLKRHPEMLTEAELVIAMTLDQAAELKAKFPAARSRTVCTFKSLAGDSGDVEDPFEQGDEVFARCRDEISRLIPRLADRIVAGP